MEIEVSIKMGWQATGMFGAAVRPKADVEVNVKESDDDNEGSRVTEILLEAAQRVIDEFERGPWRNPVPLGIALADAGTGDEVPVALSGVVESGCFETTDQEDGVEVSAWVMIDGRPAQVAAVHTSSAHFVAVGDAIEEVARAFRAGDEDSAGYDPAWKSALMGRARTQAEFVSRERLLDLERAQESVSEAKEFLALARHIADCEPAMRVLDTAYQANGRGGPLGARLRDLVGSGLPHFPRPRATHPEDYMPVESADDHS